MSKYTKEQIEAMTAGPLLDALVLEDVMGFAHYVGDEVPIDHEHLTEGIIQEVWLKDESLPSFIRYCSACGYLPDYSTDISYASEMEEALYAKSPEMGTRYANELIHLMGIGYNRTLSNMARFIRATPEQRCRAALLAVIE